MNQQFTKNTNKNFNWKFIKEPESYKAAAKQAFSKCKLPSKQLNSSTAINNTSCSLHEYFLKLGK